MEQQGIDHAAGGTPALPGTEEDRPRLPPMEDYSGKGGAPTGLAAFVLVGFHAVAAILAAVAAYRVFTGHSGMLFGLGAGACALAAIAIRQLVSEE